MYADDLLVFSPCAVGLDELLKICELYAIGHDIIFNYSKCAVMIFRNRDFKHVYTLVISTHLDTKHHMQKLTNILVTLYQLISVTNPTSVARLSIYIIYIYVQENVIARKLYMCTENVKIKLVATYCTCLYTAQLLSNYTKIDIRRTYVAYNNPLRLLFVSVGAAA